MQARTRTLLRNLRGRVAFITGGSSGIGLGIAQACALSDMKIAITYQTVEHLQIARARLDRLSADWLAIKADVTDRSAMARAVDEAEEAFGRVNLLCNNAGVGLVTPISEASLKDWDYAVSVNIGGVVNTTHIFLQRMLSHAEPAHIVSTSSMSGLFHGAHAGIYTTTKFAVVGMMEALRAELISHNIGVSVFCPGFVKSKIYLCDRNRPVPLRNPGSDAPRADENDTSREESFMENGMDPLECGKKVLDGVTRNDMYILTHPEYRLGVEERFRAILAHFSSNEEPVSARRIAAERAVLTHPIYRLGRGD